jgi:hypothetical protein
VAKRGGGDAAARVVAAAAAALDSTNPAAPFGAGTPIPLAATTTTTATTTATATTQACAASAAAARTCRTAGATVNGLATGSCRRGVDPRRGAGQQLGLAHRGERLVWRVCRQAAGPRACDAVAPHRTSPGPPFRAAGGRRPWSTAIAADVGRRTCGSSTAPRTPATARAVPAA